MTEGYDIEINDLRGFLSGCALVVQKTCSLVMGGSARDSKQQNKRVMLNLDVDVREMQKHIEQRKT